MTEAELIIEQLLGITEEVSTGIFMKQLDSGRQVFTCKCPCGTLHGGYRSFQAAQTHRKCRMCYRKEIEKTRKEIEKVDEPRKQKNIFQNRLNKPVVIGENSEDDFDMEDMKDVAKLAPDRIAYQIYNGREFYPVSRDGFIGRQGWKVNQLSSDWKIMGIQVRHDYLPWYLLSYELNRGKRFHGYIRDTDHGTLREWGREAEIYALPANESEVEWKKDARFYKVSVNENLCPQSFTEHGVSKAICEQAKPGQTFWHRFEKHADGSPLRVKVSGPCKTWESEPNEFRLPVKYGLFQTLYITEHNAGEFTTTVPSTE